MNLFLQSYIGTALWSSTDDDGEPLDKKYCRADLAPETFTQMEKDCKAFQEQAGALLENNPDSQTGHDFWLTRNRHGAGFWDGDYPDEIGRELTRISHAFGSCELYVGDNGKIYAL